MVFGSKKKRIRHSEEDEEDSRCRKCRRRDCEKVESEDEEELIHRKSSSMAHTRDAAQDLHVLVAAGVLLHDSPVESLHNHCREARAKQ